MEKISEILRRELAPAIGCTDPIGIVYAVASAKKYSAGAIEHVHCELSENIIKNASAVCIPGTSGESGIDLAAALGAIAGKPELGLEALKDVNYSDVDRAKELINKGMISISSAQNEKKLFIKVNLKSVEKNVNLIIEDNYLNISFVSIDGNEYFSNRSEPLKLNNEKESLPSLDTIIEFSENAPLEELGIIKDAIRLNMAIAEEGMSKAYGLGTGKNLKKSIERGYLGDDLLTEAMMWTAAGVDSRMAGSDMPVMSNTGSGNQGLTATVPVVCAGRKLKKSEEAIIRAVTVSNLTTIYIKSELGLLSPICGAAVAAAGSGCGIIYLLGGGRTHMAAALSNTLTNVAGILCDGAKGSCALKVSTCINAAVQGALLAMDDICVKETDGLAGKDETETIRNFVELAHKGMAAADHVILDIILRKNNRNCY